MFIRAGKSTFRQPITSNGQKRKMVYMLALIGTLLITLMFRRAVLYMPVWTLLTPKALLLLDVPSLPAFSLYKYFCMLLISTYLLTLALDKKRTFEKKPFSRAFYILLIPATLSAVINIASRNSGLLTASALAVEIVLPTTIYCHYLGSINQSQINKLAKKYIFWYCMFATYGTIAYLTGYNPYIDFINSTTHTGRILARTYEETLRGARAQGTTSHPITYGALIIMMLLTYYILKFRNKLKTRDIIKVGLATTIIVGSALFTNSRTPLILFAVPVLFFAVTAGIAKSLKTSIIIAVIFLIAFSASGIFREKVLSVANIFDSEIGTEQNGSDLAMRASQLMVSTKYFMESPIVGAGLDATRNIVASGAEPDLYNSESLVFRLMIEQGGLGFISYGVFFVLLYSKTAKLIENKSSKKLYLGLIIGYVVFSVATGIMDTLQNFLFLLCLIHYAFKIDHPQKIVAGSKYGLCAPSHLTH